SSSPSRYVAEAVRLVTDLALTWHGGVTDLAVASRRARARGHLCPRRPRAAAGGGGGAPPGRCSFADDRRACRPCLPGSEATPTARHSLRGARPSAALAP